MNRKRTTLELDEALLRSIVERAALTGRSQRDIIEDALRRGLDPTSDDAQREQRLARLEAVVRRAQTGNQLGEDQALRLAYDELDAARVDDRHAKGA